jgi:hypothetical protein
VVQADQEIPDLKIALSEGGTGWIPYFLERADRTYEMHSTWTGQDFGGKLPSEQDNVRKRHALVSLRPVHHISREQATVGALRKAAEDHGVSIKACRTTTRATAETLWRASYG